MAFSTSELSLLIKTSLSWSLRLCVVMAVSSPRQVILPSQGQGPGKAGGQIRVTLWELQGTSGTQLAAYLPTNKCPFISFETTDTSGSRGTNSHEEDLDLPLLPMRSLWS